MELSKNDWEDSLRKIEKARQLLQEKEYDEAAKLANEVLNQDFANTLALFILGYVFLKAERWGLAYNMFRRVIQLDPNKAEPWNNAGLCYQDTWNLDEAEKCFIQSLKLEPDNQAALANMALIYVNRCQPDKALEYVRKSEKVGPLNWEGLDNKALALLMKREWSEGWDLYRQTAGRVKQREIRIYREPAEQFWNGEKANIVLYGCQGIGDEIAFSSCISDAVREAKSVTFDCDHRLEGLFKRSFPQVEVHGTRFKEKFDWNEGKEIDYSLPIDCLPQLFRRENNQFPGIAYLKADPERVLQWKSLFETFKKPVIGIAWTGGLVSTGKKKRSLTLESLLPIFKSIDAEWVSLEYRDRDKEIEDFRKKYGIEIRQYKRATFSSDFDDVAGLIGGLDLVVSVTTAVIHLSGALGKDCWCITPNKPRWFYGLEGDLPWYKSVKMFRQEKDGKWPIQKISDLLKLKYESSRLSR